MPDAWANQCGLRHQAQAESDDPGRHPALRPSGWLQPEPDATRTYANRSFGTMPSAVTPWTK